MAAPSFSFAHPLHQAHVLPIPVLTHGDCSALETVPLDGSADCGELLAAAAPLDELSPDARRGEGTFQRLKGGAAVLTSQGGDPRAPGAAHEAPESASFILHQVSRFDTLAGLAVKYGVQVERLKRENRLTSDLQLFALGCIRIPLDGHALPSPNAAQTPSSPPARDSSAPNTGGPLLHLSDGAPCRFANQSCPTNRKPVAATPLDSAGTTFLASRREEGAAAAAAAVQQLVESVDPELLLGVKGLRTAAEVEGWKWEGGGGASEGSGEGDANAVALLLALQNKGHGSRGNSLVLGLGVQGLTFGSKSEALDEGSSSRESARRVRGSSLPAPEHQGLHCQEQRSSYHMKSGSFWEHEFGSEDNRRQDGAVAPSALMDVRATPAGLSTGKVFVRRRQGAVAVGGSGKGIQGEDSSGLSSGEEPEGAGWLSADEYLSGRADIARLGQGISAAPAVGGGWGPANCAASREKGSTGPSRASAARMASTGSTSFESLDMLSRPAPVTAAAQWGTRVIDDLLGSLRRSGGWLLDRSLWDGNNTGPGKASTEVGIDLQVMGHRGGVGSSERCLTKKEPSAGAFPAVNDALSRSVPSTSSAHRRSSKGKPSVD